MSISLDLDLIKPGTNDTTNYKLSNKWLSLFSDAQLKITGKTKVQTVQLTNVETGLNIGFGSNGADHVTINGVTFSIAHSGTTWTITSSVPETAHSNNWSDALDLLRVQGNTAEHGLDTVTVKAFIGASSNYVAAGEDLTVICFYPGTLIRTPAGDVAVETLKHGDLVLTHDGREVPVCWLGRQTVSTVFADPLRALPIRIKAGALAENVPSRDLLVSPDHALLVDGVLINAGALVNDASIVRETDAPAVFTYFHVEVADHSLIFAEGALAETFVDNVDRLGFDNWDEYEALYPEGRAVEEMPYPRAKARRQVPVSIRVALAARAEAIGAVAEAAAAVA
jgi:hypothetical protein